MGKKKKYFITLTDVFVEYCEKNNIGDPELYAIRILNQTFNEIVKPPIFMNNFIKGKERREELESLKYEPQKPFNYPPPPPLPQEPRVIKEGEQPKSTNKKEIRKDLYDE